MKKMVFAVTLTAIGFVFTAFSFIWAAVNPWSYNGISGLYGSFLGTDMIWPFLISLVIMIGGLILLFYEAYFRKKE